MGSSVWPSIVKLFGKFKSDGLLPPNVLWVKIGNGKSIHFWKDNWRGDGALASKYNRLMHLDENSDCLLTDRFINGQWHDGILPSMEIVFKWCKHISRKVNIFIWRLAWDRLPTRLNFSKRGMEIEDIGCPICDGRIELVDHLFFGCSFALDLWRKICLWVNGLKDAFDSYYFISSMAYLEIPE
ncbi:uncharacterized protein [Rutidosis leptorrhynchoides]|uniref:uncharacterized protein n=1 Tax=Rutidosis leptorrhynchoides TaxID=125765 RepID=UPI003A992D2A